jgi:hypothetical protein
MKRLPGDLIQRPPECELVPSSLTRRGLGISHALHHHQPLSTHMISDTGAIPRSAARLRLQALSLALLKATPCYSSSCTQQQSTTPTTSTRHSARHSEFTQQPTIQQEILYLHYSPRISFTARIFTAFISACGYTTQTGHATRFCHRLRWSTKQATG